jgi:phosphatidylserine/phosphatidylglycerophosphate/cardiolipin synthase-like enzyme
MWLDTAPHAIPAGSPPPIVQRAPDWEVHYGGPDRPPRALRNLLKAHIDAAPAGSEIIWATYYFRDRDLADALVAARRRGVRVRVLLDARPRRSDANAAVIARLGAGLGDGLRLHRAGVPGSRLHAKIYAFSGPRPTVFIGSFNPSGDQPEDPAVVAEIGDQDRGHNLLVQFRKAQVVDGVLSQARRLWRDRGVSRFSPDQNQPVQAGPTTLYFFPRLRPDVVERQLGRLGPRDSVRAAVSHLGSGPFASALASAAQRGARVDLVVHDTERRAPDGVVTGLARSGVSIRRYCHPKHLPMHAKFLIVERGDRTAAWFGSLNYNLNSQYLNQEILVHSTSPDLTSELERRFVTIAAESERLSGGRADLCQARPTAVARRPDARPRASLTYASVATILGHLVRGALAPSAIVYWWGRGGGR